MRILLFMGNGNVVESSGGAEKVLCNMADEMALRGHHVSVLCDDLKEGYPFYPLLSDVDFINLGGVYWKKDYPQSKKILREMTKPFRKTFFRSFFPDPIEKLRIRDLSPRLRDAIHRIEPDVIISFFLNDHYVVTESVGCERYPLLVMHHNAPEMDLLDAPRQKIRSLRKCVCLQLLLPGFEKQVNQTWPWLKTVTIPNTVPPVDDGDIADLSRRKKEYTITMIARLDPKQKQQHFLIQAFSQIAHDYPDWKVKFYGGVYDKKYAVSLEERIRSLHLQDRVFLMGTTERPLDVLRESDIFAFPTAFEGFGLALAEAMAVGLPCVGLKTASAVNELIIDGHNGLLSENNVKDFAAKLKILMDNPQLRVTMGKNGHEFVKQFEPRKIWDQWENLIRETVEQHRKKPSEKDQGQLPETQIRHAA